MIYEDYPWKQLYWQQSQGGCGLVEIELRYRSSREFNVDQHKHSQLCGVVDLACEKVHKELYACIYLQDPELQESFKLIKIEIKSLFPESYAIEEIPNEYSNEAYYRGKPWFKVATPKGILKIGWRKCVIEINWSGFLGNKPKAQDIFADKDVTKGEYFIHAWSYKDAKQYLSMLGCV